MICSFIKTQTGLFLQLLDGTRNFHVHPASSSTENNNNKNGLGNQKKVLSNLEISGEFEQEHS